MPSIFFTLLCLTLGGCGSPNQNTESNNGQGGADDRKSSVASPAPFDRMRQLAERQQWQEAWTLSREVMVSQGQDPQTLAYLANVAFNCGLKKDACDLLLEANKYDNYKTQALIDRAIIVFVAEGQMFTAIDLLYRAIEAQPTNIPLRRSLSDFLRGAGRDEAAEEQLREIVKQRQFDFGILLSLIAGKEHELEVNSVKEMAERNPDDRRPLLAVAKSNVDDGQIDNAIAVLESIVSLHPDDVPSQALLGQLLAQTGKSDRFTQWMQQAENLSSLRASWRYWMAVGIHHANTNALMKSGHCFAKAARLHPNSSEAWLRLLHALRLLQKTATTHAAIESHAGIEDLVDSQIAFVQERISLLSKLADDRSRFLKTTAPAVDETLEIAKTLNKLGRRWEAEAWSAMAVTIAGPRLPEVNETRDAIVRSLSKSSAWQDSDNIDELDGLWQDSWLPESSQNITQTLGPNNNQSFELRDEAAARQLTFFGRTREGLDKPGIPFYATLGCGGATIDYDHDGWPDLMFADAGGTPMQRDNRTNVLFRNQSGILEQVTANCGIRDADFGQAISIGDMNEDGFSDCVMLNYGANRLLLNQGDGTFVDRTSSFVPATPERWSSGGAVVDIDADGLADLFVVNYCRGNEPITARCINPKTGAERACAPTRFEGEADEVWRNQGDGRFQEMSGKWLTSPPQAARGLGVIAGELDHTPGVDIYVANDMSFNHYYTTKTSPSLRLEETAMAVGLAGDIRGHAQGSMGIAAGDFNHNQHQDLFVTNFEREYNTLYDQSSPGLWNDKTNQLFDTSYNFPHVGFGAQAIDLDNDGWLEIAFTNGHIDFPENAGQSSYAQPFCIAQRTSSGSFIIKPQTPSLANYLHADHVGRALGLIDANGDGALDLWVTHQTEPIALLINHTTTKNHWIGIRLVGTTSSRDAIGASVQLKCQDATYSQRLTSGDGYMASNERTLRFGLGEETSPCTAVITWPSGRRETFSELKVDREHILIEGSETIP